jgi:hypothetical protein
MSRSEREAGALGDETHDMPLSEEASGEAPDDVIRAVSEEMRH